MSKVTRLHQFFQPETYDLNLKINKKKLTFNGSVNVTGILAKGSLVRLHSKDLSINRVLIDNCDMPYNILPEIEELQIPVKINAKKLTIKIDFSGKITRPMHGMYPCYGRDNSVLIATQFESHHAREVFPCIDEPVAKAIFTLTLTTPAEDTVLSNTEQIKSTTDGQNKTTIFKPTPKMSSYLLAFLFGDIRHIKTMTKHGTLVRCWATPDQFKNLNFSLEVAKHSLEFFKDYFAIPYPLEKCDLVALPDFAAGAMENWGLITFREICMLVDEQSTTTENKQYAAMVIAHELAHQWFGNLVTMEWWDDLWLNEGFASWIEFLAIDKQFPQWHMWTHFLATEQLAALRLDALKNTHPVQTSIGHPDEIRTNFDTISYAKGASVIHMLHKYLGKKDFRLGLSHYLSKYAHSNTSTDDLWLALEEISHKPVKKFMQNWTQTSGYPVLEIKYTKDVLSLEQRRFIFDGSKVNGDLWQIPLNSTGINKEIFTEKTLKLSCSNPEKLIVNQGHSGFYITKYWPEHYQSIAKFFKHSLLEENDRLGTLSDMLALNRAGLLEISYLFEVINYLQDETSTPVWDIMTLILGDVRRIMGMQTKEDLKPFIKHLTTTQVQRLGWTEGPKDSYYDKLLRPIVLGLASSADNPEVVDRARSIFSKATKVQDIPVYLRHMVLLSVARRGNAADYDKIIKFYDKTNSPEDKVGLLNALLRFKDPSIYKKSLNLINSDRVRLQDASYGIIFALSNPYAKYDAWLWLNKNWQWLKTNLGRDMAFARLPVNIANVFSDAKFIEQYREFFTKNLEPSLELSTKQGIEILQAQVKWRHANEKQLSNWLNKH